MSTHGFTKMRKQLFQDFLDSPQSTDNMWADEDIQNIVTPGEKGDSLFKLSIPHRPSQMRSRKSLFGGKRLGDDMDESPFTKKMRQEFEITVVPKSDQTENIAIQTVVERLVTQTDLVADGSRDHTLPTIPGKHSDLKSISADTMTDVLTGRYDSECSRVTIVDCRYPYEYEGGHIRGAVNLYTKDDVYSLLQQPVATDKPHILIFHCEFSSERGPKMYRFLRNEDRQLNKDCYPKLNYPEVYLLHGGYKEFYTNNKEECVPVAYKPMLHSEHSEDLRHFRRKSKSWTAGENDSKNRRKALRKPKLSLEF